MASLVEYNSTLRQIAIYKIIINLIETKIIKYTLNKLLIIN